MAGQAGLSACSDKSSHRFARKEWYSELTGREEGGNGAAGGMGRMGLELGMMWTIIVI